MALPRWECHKIVEAAKITGCRFGLDGIVVLVMFEGEARVRSDWVDRHAPDEDWQKLVGGYFVRYADDYESWSPAAAFESGYSRLTDEGEESSGAR